MGQATVDLPDPMQPAPMTAMSSDDLLAQLAGDEIDRLLAEVEAETPPDTQPALPLPSFSDPPPSPSGAAPEAAALGAQAAEVDAAVNAQLDDLFAQLELDAPTAPPEAPPGAPPAAATIPELPDSLLDSPSVAAAVAPDAISAALESPAPADTPPLDPVPATETSAQPDAATSAAERDALADNEMTEVAAAIEAELVAAAPVPVYLRPLEWLSAPLASFPDPVREIVGKIAILTTANAVSILVYVFFFRRH